MRSHLQIKVFSLTAEMTYIRRQEEKWKSRARRAREKGRDDSYAFKNFWSQRGHRGDLKLEARTAHLAYGFLRGQSYSAMERICYGPLKGYGSTEPNWDAVSTTVERFTKDDTDPQGTMQRFSEWLTDAKVWYEGNEKRIKEMVAAQVAAATAKRLAAKE